MHACLRSSPEINEEITEETNQVGAAHLVGHRGERTLDVDHGHMPDRFEEDR
jgi:hypothetical protein